MLVQRDAVSIGSPRRVARASAGTAAARPRPRRPRRRRAYAFSMSVVAVMYLLRSGGTRPARGRMDRGRRPLRRTAGGCDDGTLRTPAHWLKMHARSPADGAAWATGYPPRAARPANAPSRTRPSPSRSFIGRLFTHRLETSGFDPSAPMLSRPRSPPGGDEVVIGNRRIDLIKLRRELSTSCPVAKRCAAADSVASRSTTSSVARDQAPHTVLRFCMPACARAEARRSYPSAARRRVQRHEGSDTKRASR